MSEPINIRLPEPIDQEGQYELYDARTNMSVTGVKKYETFSEWSEKNYNPVELVRRHIDEINPVKLERVLNERID